MQLTTQRLIIIPCTEETISSFQYKIGPHIKMHIENLRSDPTLIGWGPWLVLEKNSDKVVGDIGFKGRPNAENTVEVGYGILPQFQNKGYATEAVKEIIKWAFSSEQVTRVVAECLEDNLSSVKVLEKLGMNRTGTIKTIVKWQLLKNN